MSSKFKKILKLLSIPLIILGVYLILLLVWNIFHLPLEKELIEILKDAFQTYGLWIVLVGAFFEGILFIGFYFPGATIVFLATVLVGTDVLKITEIIAIVSAAFLVSYSLNYLMGKYGWYKLLIKMGFKDSLDKAQEKLQKNSLGVVMLSYWNPNFASIIATAAGVLQIPFWKFFPYNLMGIIGWNILWGILAAVLGANAMQFMGIKYVILSLAVWIIAILLKYYLWDKRKSKK